MYQKILMLIGTCFALMLITPSASAAIASHVVDYETKDGNVMEGYLAVADDLDPKKGAIILVPDWMGVGQFAIDKANQLADERYIVLVADVYGKDVRPANQEQAGLLAGKYKKDRPLLRTNIQAAYDFLLTVPNVDPQKILVMGYCFGGTTALELGRNAAPLVGIVSFHGGLSNPTPENAKNIKSPVLVMHGADDPNVPPSEVQAFKDEMKAANVDLQFVSYLGAVHSFTNPAAGNDNSKGAAYNETADRESWLEFHRFLDKVFK